MELKVDFKNISFVKEDKLAIITINRPKALNALNTETLIELNSLIDNLEEDENTTCIILTGSGEKAFVAGADIAEMKGLNRKGAEEFGLLGNRVFRRLEMLNKPVIAAISGFALGGGCELAMACDIRIASEKARFAQPEVGLGIIPGFGGTQRLPRLVGQAKAKELIYTGIMIDAEEALRIGLINKIVPLENLIEEAKKLANSIMVNGPIAIRLSKNAINRGIEVDIDTALGIEAEYFGKCFNSEDQVEGMTAFLERRPKHFQNK